MTDMRHSPPSSFPPATLPSANPNDPTIYRSIDPAIYANPPPAPVKTPDTPQAENALKKLRQAVRLYLQAYDSPASDWPLRRELLDRLRVLAALR